MSRDRLPAMPRGAFSAIELLIAIALGTMVLLTGYSAIRVAATSIATGNRLMNENGLLRQAMVTGIEQADFGAPGEFTGDDQGLVYRRPTARAMTSLFAADGTIRAELAHLSRTALTNRPVEDWWPWRVNLDGRGWSYGDDAAAPWQYDPTGASGLLAGENNRPVYQRGVAGDTRSALRGMTNQAYQAMTGWGKGAQIDLYRAFGYWAMLEYMPPNAVFYCDPLTRGQIPSGICDGSGRTASTWGRAPFMGGRDAAMARPMASGSPWCLAGRIQFQQNYGIDISTGGVATLLTDRADLDWFGMIHGVDGRAYAIALFGTGRPPDPLPRSGEPVAGRVGWDGNWQASRQAGLPSDWPRCGLIVQRAWTDALRLNRVEIKLRSPITGQDLSISFNCLGADLPGLRKSHGWHD